MRRILASLLASSLLVASPAAGAEIDTSMLDRWTPDDRAGLASSDNVALAYLARGWLLAGDRRQAETVLDELRRRGDMAYGIEREWAPFPPVTSEPNPADTAYTVTLTQVGNAFDAAGYTPWPSIRMLEDMPLTSAGGCWPNSALDVAAGCLHNANLIAIAFASRHGIPYEHQLAYELATQTVPGQWLYWQDAPEGYWAHGKPNDAGHLAWSAWELMDTDDPRLRALGRDAAEHVSQAFDPVEDPPFAYYAVVAARVAAGLPGGCDLVSTLPGYAEDYPVAGIDEVKDRFKAQQWTAFVHVWAQTRC